MSSGDCPSVVSFGSTSCRRLPAAQNLWGRPTI